MKFITVTPSQRTLLEALYTQKHMRYLVHDSMGDASVYARCPEFNETDGFWTIPGLQLAEVEYLSEETVSGLCDELGIRLDESPFPFFWLSAEDGPVPIHALLEQSETTGTTTMEAVKAG